ARSGWTRVSVPLAISTTSTDPPAMAIGPPGKRGPAATTRGWGGGRGGGRGVSALRDAEPGGDRSQVGRLDGAGLVHGGAICQRSDGGARLPALGTRPPPDADHVGRGEGQPATGYVTEGPCERPCDIKGWGAPWGERRGSP